MEKLSFRIAFPVIVSGLFVVMAFLALGYQTLNRALFIILIFLAVYIFLFGFAVGQNFSSPIKKILKKATELSEGDLKSRVYLENKDELGELARVFNKVAEELEESRSKADRIDETVGIKVKAETQALQDVINSLEQKVKNRTVEIQKMIEDSKKMQDQLKLKEVEVQEFKKQVEGLKAGIGKNK